MSAPLYAARVAELQARIAAAQASIEPVDFPWYAYHSLGGVQFLESLLVQADLTLDEIVAGQPLLDIGCADGHLSFYLESLSYQVTAVDHAPTSANDMKGVRALKQSLGSAIEILDIDLDRGFTPPRTDYGFVVLMGILYHLKNPFLILERLSEVADYCLLSTRIARFAPDGTRLEKLPIAYLLGEDEANGDPSNFWIFSEAGLRRLVHRAGWDIRASLHSGNTRRSDPATTEGDERIYCLLSRSSLFTNGKLREGWYSPEGPRNGWRWTAPRFSIEFPTPAVASMIDIDVYVAEGAPALSAIGNGKSLGSRSFDPPGIHRWRIPLPRVDAVRFVLEFNVAKGPSASDTRLLGVIINQIHLRPA